jgi:hypothetical protein
MYGGILVRCLVSFVPPILATVNAHCSLRRFEVVSVRRLRTDKSAKEGERKQEY